MAVDIREVAQRSGASVATVSRALNGRPDVSAATRARVEAVARELGYRPNSQARAPVRRRSDIVGLIWDTTYVRTRGRHPFLQDVLVGLKTALAETGWSLLLLSPDRRGGSTQAFARTAAQHSLDGVALMSVDEHLPAVEALAAEHLLALGHRRIATITGPVQLRAAPPSQLEAQRGSRSRPSPSCGPGSSHMCGSSSTSEVGASAAPRRWAGASRRARW